jgi:hypothetical protein
VLARHRQVQAVRSGTFLEYRFADLRSVAYPRNGVIWVNQSFRCIYGAAARSPKAWSS